MQLKGLIFSVITLFFFFDTVVPVVAQPTPDLVRRILSEELGGEIIPRNAKARIKVSWVSDDDREIKIVLYPLRNGEIVAEWTVPPPQEPIFDQVGKLRSMYDNASFEEVIPFLVLDRTLVTDNMCAGLKDLVARLEELTLPIVTVDEPLIIHGNLYYIEIGFPFSSNRLEWYFSGDADEGSSEAAVPVLKWIEDLAGTLEKCVMDQ